MTPLKTMSEMQFGIAISPFVMSAIVHTAEIVMYGPIATARMYIQRYTFTIDLFPWVKYSRHRSE